jgi:two-component system sensor histidine kinase RegB
MAHPEQLNPRKDMLSPTMPSLAEAPPDPVPASDTANRKNMMLLIQLRWIAVGGQIATIAFVRLALGITLPLMLMALVLAGLVLLNLGGFLWLRTHRAVSSRALLMVLVLDVVALTAQLWLSGGATNPFAALYLLQVTLAAVLLDGRSTWLVVALTCANFAGLAVFSEPLMLPDRYRGDMFSLHIVGMLVCFGLDAALLVVFMARITTNLRERDANLAAMKQREAEEDHIVRMGLLATGAAHELGTPLASIAVILGDWRRMPTIAADADLGQEVEEMQAAVQRCKAIVTGILLAAGEARGEGPVVTSVKAFLNEIVADWRAARATTALTYENRFGADLPIVSDPALKQVLCNVLDNALEASPDWVGFFAHRVGDTLVLEISDAGAGFAPEMLAQFGKPYQSSKGKPGGGLGLFLVVNVVRKFGGTVEAHNLAGRGAVVTLHLPLDALALGAPDHVD